MKTSIAIASVSAIFMSLAAPSAFALSEDEENVLGAVAILGLAAVAHNEHHYHDGYKPANADATARFERGYRDGLHNEPYDSRRSSFDYGQGYDAGQKERRNRLAHKRRDVGGTTVPARAMRACRNEVASSLGVDNHHVHAVNAGQEGANNFYVEFAAGHRHLICGTNSQGEVFNLRNGRL